jgi:hypothetical protein
MLQPRIEFNQESGIRNQESVAGRVGFVFDDADGMDAAGDWEIERLKHSVRFICPHCGHLHTDTRLTRAQWNARGQYLDANLKPFDLANAPERVSFHLEASVTRWWYLLLEEYLNALNALRRGVVDAFKVFIQKARALTWSETTLFTAKPTRNYELSAEDWADEHVRFFTLDFQDDDVWWGVIVAWSKTGQARRIFRDRFTSESEILARQAEYKVKPAHVGIDCGFKTKRVYAMCVRNGWVAFRGDHRQEFIRRVKQKTGGSLSYRSSGEDYYGDPETGQVHAGRRWAIVIRWSNPTIKDRVQQSLDRELFSIPKTLPGDERELEWKRQMNSEYKRRKRNPITGLVKMEWVCPSGNNHYRDALCMNFGMATVKRILPDIEAVPDAEAVK